MNTEQKIAYELFMRLPFWKRRQFFKWVQSNNWDVKHVMEDCKIKAREILTELNRPVPCVK